MSKQVNYNENLCSGAAIRDDKGRRISKLFEASHPKMTVGYAKNLIMPDTPTEQEFNFRQSGGGVIEDGVAVIDKVKGKSLVWNQLVNIHSKIDDGEIEQLNFTKGHKYLVFWKQDVDIPSSTRNTLRIDFLYNQKTGENNHPNAGYYNWMFTFEEDSGTHFLAWWIQGHPEGVTPSISNILFYDLTQMFGAGNEPTTYEEFLSRKPKVADEYAYNEGIIINNKVEKVVTTGRNLWDEEWELGGISSSTGANVPSSSDIRSKNYIPVMPGTTYYCKCPQTSLNVKYYDANKNFLEAFNTTIVNAFSVPSGAHYLRFWGVGTTYNHDICINISDPAINGKYFPYEEHELDLSWVKDIKDADGVKLFEDGMKSAGTAFDEAAKGRAIKRVGVVDMGKITWNKRDDISPSMFASYGVAPNYKIGLCPIASINKNQYDATLVDGALYWMGNYVMMYNSKFTTIDDFVNFVSGTPIYYELAEPIEVEYDEKNLTYPVVAGGTEEAIASEPSTAFRADVGYGIDAVKTILDLKARVEALEGK